MSGKVGKRSQYFTLQRHLRKYLRDYGGAKAILLSPFFCFSVISSALSYSSISTAEWAQSALSVLPNLLGFSLGTYALLFSLMSPRLKRALKTVSNNAGIPYIDEINATFLHFIIVQIVCIIWSFLYQQTLLFDIFNMLGSPKICSTPIFDICRYVGGFIGCILFIYSLSLVVGSSLAVYRLARLVEPSESEH